MSSLGSVSLAGRWVGTHYAQMLQPGLPQYPCSSFSGGILWFVVCGVQVAEAVNALSQGAPHNELLNSPDAVITDVGQIRRSGERTDMTSINSTST
jgi:hypothetical protein